MLDNFRNGDMLDNISVPAERIQSTVNSAIDSAVDEIAESNPDVTDSFSDGLKEEFRNNLDKDELNKQVSDHYRTILVAGEDDSIYIARIYPQTKRDLSTPTEVSIMWGKYFSFPPARESPPTYFKSSPLCFELLDKCENQPF